MLRFTRRYFRIVLSYNVLDTKALKTNIRCPSNCTMNRWNTKLCLVLLSSLAGCYTLPFMVWYTVIRPIPSTSKNTYDLHARPMVHSHIYQAEAHQARLDLVRMMCKEYKTQHPPRDVIQQPSEFLVVDEKHKVIYCNIPKVGCTSWKKLFLSISGFSSKMNKEELNLLGRTKLTYVHKYNITHRRYVLENYTKFVFVRDPFTRLLSAYQEKLSPWSRLARNDYYTTVGLRIIRQLQGQDTEQHIRAHMGQYNLTFGDFIHYLVDERTEVYDKHWERFHDLCLPCDIDYDFVGKLETFDEDVAYILNSTGIDTPFPQPKWFTNSSNKNIVEDFYQIVSPTDLQKLYHDRFIFDFKLFGYSPRTFTRNIFPESLPK